MADWAGAYGAGGASDALRQFLVDKLTQQKFVEEQRQAKAREAADVAQRNQAANLAHEGLVQRQSEMVTDRDNAYQTRLEGVRTRDQNVLEHKADREADAHLREIDAAARAQARVDDQKFTEAEHQKQRDFTAGQNALERSSLAARAAASHSGGLDSGEKARLTMQMGKTYMFNTKAQREIERQYGLMTPAVDIIQKRGPGYGNAEQVVVNAFNKIIDPNSVVREGEYDRTAKGQALLAKMEVFGQRIKQGGTIAPETLTEMANLARTYAEQAHSYNQRVKDLTTKQATAFGLDPTILFMDEGDDAPGGAPPGPHAPAAAAPAAGGAVQTRVQVNKRTGEKRTQTSTDGVTWH